MAHNKSLQTDNLRGVCIVVSLSLNGTTMQTPHKLRLSEALVENSTMKDIQRNSFVVPLTTYDDSKILVLSQFSGNQKDPHQCVVRVQSGGFGFEGNFYFDNYSRFTASVEQMAIENAGSAELREDYKEQAIKLEILKLGHVLVSGVIEQYGDHSQVLRFGFKTDQTCLAQFGKDLRRVIE